MIYDRLENRRYYNDLNEGIRRGLQMLADADFENLPNGKHVLGDEDVYMNISAYETKPHELVKMEAHREYLDIQYIIRGEEQVALASIEDAVLLEERPENDIYFYEVSGLMSRLAEGHFMVLYPHEVHGPNLCVEKLEAVRKAVVKVRIK